MTGGLALRLAMFASLALPPIPLAAQEDSQQWQVSRTEWGDPDFRGMWPLEVGQTPMQRNPRYGEQAWLTDEEYAAALTAASQLNAGADVEERSDTLGAGSWFERGRVLRQTSLVMEPANGRIPPLTEEGKRRAALMRSSWVPGQTFDSVEDFDTWDRCVTRGFPASMLPFRYNNGVRIFQSPGYVVIALEMAHEARIIPTNGLPPLHGTIK